MSLNAVTPVGKKMPLWPQLGKELTDELADFSASSVLDGSFRVSLGRHWRPEGRERLSGALLHLTLLYPVLTLSGRFDSVGSSKD